MLSLACATLLGAGCGLRHSQTPSRWDNYRILVIYAEAKVVSNVRGAGEVGEIADIYRMCEYSGSVIAGDPEVHVVWDAGSNSRIAALDEVLSGLDQFGYTVFGELDGIDGVIYRLRQGEDGPFEINLRATVEPTGNEVLARIMLAKSPC